VPHPYEQLSPATALAEAANLLSRTNLDDTWALVALLSLVDTLPATNEERILLFPLLNWEKIRMLSSAVLASKALSYKKVDLTPHQFLQAMNYANAAALGDKEILEAQGPLKNIGGSDLFFRFFFARLGNVQIRYQDIRFEDRVGRLIAMFETLPRTHRAKMPLEFWTRADIALAEVHKFLGNPIHLYAVCPFVFSEHSRAVYADVLSFLRAARDQSASKMDLLLNLFLSRRKYGSRLVVTVQMEDHSDLEKIFRDIVPRFMRIFARTTRELRDLIHQQEVYRKGAVSYRLNPLERYPIVWLDKNRVIVPNLRFLFRNFTDILHFALQEAVPWYDELRGGLQELYLRALIEAKLSGVTIIPERTYKRGKQSVKGPDLILIENDRLILVESKARRFVAETRFTMNPELFVQNLGGAVDAIKALSLKHSELYQRLPEYEDVQAILDRTRCTEPLFVAVVGDEVSMMGEAVRGLERYDTNFPLREFSHQWDIVGIDGFDRAVELAASSGRTLREVIEEHISRSQVIDHDTPAADQFEMHEPGPASFARSFIRSGLNDQV
jgi:hypothetical protein